MALREAAPAPAPPAPGPLSESRRPPVVLRRPASGGGIAAGADHGCRRSHGLRAKWPRSVPVAARLRLSLVDSLRRLRMDDTLRTFANGSSVRHFRVRYCVSDTFNPQSCPTFLATTLSKTRSSMFGMFRGGGQSKLRKRGRNS